MHGREKEGGGLDGWLALALAALYVVDFKPVKGRSVERQTSNLERATVRWHAVAVVPGTATNAASSHARSHSGRSSAPGISVIYYVR